MRAVALQGDSETDVVVDVINPSGEGGCVLVCEHASNFIPHEFNGLGLSDDVLASHIAWDSGALALAIEMSKCLDAPLVAQKISRLVYDCNRYPDARSAIAERSEIYDIPGNVNLTIVDKQDRVARFYAPFRTALSNTIEGKMANCDATVVVTVHSFSPVFEGKCRNLDIGVLHDDDSRFADKVLEMAHADTGLDVRRNQPYSAADGVTFTLREHGVSRGLLNVMFEIRSDLIADEISQHAMATRLAGYIQTALGAMEVDRKGAVAT